MECESGQVLIPRPLSMASVLIGIGMCPLELVLGGYEEEKSALVLNWLQVIYLVHARGCIGYHQCVPAASMVMHACLLTCMWGVGGLGENYHVMELQSPSRMSTYTYFGLIFVSGNVVIATRSGNNIMSPTSFWGISRDRWAVRNHRAPLRSCPH